MCFDFGLVCILHHRLASNLVRCDLVLYVDCEIVTILSLSFIR